MILIYRHLSNMKFGKWFFYWLARLVEFVGLFPVFVKLT